MQTLELIEQETSERNLLAIAFACEGDMKSGQITAEHYAECMVALSKKLGFGITSDSLANASDKYITPDIKQT